jgi:hypothetical protein
MEKRNIGENSCLRAGTLTDFKKDVMRIPGWERANPGKLQALQGKYIPG